ncbi:putative Ig domain-containing protein, partial [Xanthovirga aplysinae]|uniref:putative Ig domain-containing protein n=1 Tax=Xanthovirga aplysinae TaxID=2529853 RepID=UPI0012BC48DB
MITVLPISLSFKWFRIRGLFLFAYIFFVLVSISFANSPKNHPDLSKNELFKESFYFPLISGASIKGEFWWDVNENQSKDAQEIHLESIVKLYWDKNSNGILEDTDLLIEEKETNWGVFNFTGLAAGNYIVDPGFISQLPIIKATTTVPLPVNLSEGELFTGADFGFNFTYGISSIGDFVWNDLNGNGMQDDGDQTGLAGVSIDLFLDVNANGTLELGQDIQVGKQITNEEGFYRFEDLISWYFIVQISDENEVLTNYQPTTPNSLAVGQLLWGSYLDADFGFQPFPNNPPVLDVIEDQNINEEETLFFTASATDDDISDELTFNLDQMSIDKGMQIDSQTGEFSWTPTEIQGGEIYEVTLTVTDNGFNSLSDSQTFTITVNEVNTNPSNLSLSEKEIGEQAEELSTVGLFSAEDSDFPPNNISFLLVDPMPNSSNDNVNFLIEGNALKTAVLLDFEKKSSYVIDVKADDGEGGSIIQAFTISVTNHNEPPFFTSEPLTNAKEGVTYTYEIITKDEDQGDQRSISILEKPDWLIFEDHQDGTALLSGTPTNFDVGNYDVRLEVKDIGGLIQNQEFQIQVEKIEKENSTPENILLSDQNISENEPIGTLVGDFSTIDKDINDLHTYSLVASETPNDNDYFQ